MPQLPDHWSLVLAEDSAFGFKQLAEVERGRRLVEQVFEVRPACHRREDRIKARARSSGWPCSSCARWRRAAGTSWLSLRNESEKMLGSFQGAAGSFHQRSEITAPQRAIFAKLRLVEPPLNQELTPLAPAS